MAPSIKRYDCFCCCSYRHSQLIQFCQHFPFNFRHKISHVDTNWINLFTGVTVQTVGVIIGEKAACGLIIRTVVIYLECLDGIESDVIIFPSDFV